MLGCGDDDNPARPDSGGTDAGESDAGGMDAGGDDAGGDDAGGDDAGGDAGGDDAGSDDAGGGCSGDTITAAVSNNHGHTLSIPVADILAGEEKSYVTGGVTTHCHIVTLTAADFATLQSGGEVRVVSCNNTEHEYALSCAGMIMAGDPAPTCGTSNEGRFMGTCTGDTFTP